MSASRFAWEWQGYPPASPRVEALPFRESLLLADADVCSKVPSPALGRRKAALTSTSEREHSLQAATTDVESLQGRP
jgi:hypothetical protein